ncbi:hypothetical protein PoB_000995000 [Plakobranchus ocellatus]|uniref:Uncharacterized protein n=1 Tax=Plakobranchus ocellatus TaxID=259542 RepID=A0AAV3YL28_9GAST|nr:hypothetical protein PoB_000995000 [Plakobranchus ocellatus]
MHWPRYSNLQRHTTWIETAWQGRSGSGRDCLCRLTKGQLELGLHTGDGHQDVQAHEKSQNFALCSPCFHVRESGGSSGRAVGYQVRDPEFESQSGPSQFIIAPPCLPSTKWEAKSLLRPGDAFRPCTDAASTVQAAGTVASELVMQAAGCANGTVASKLAMQSAGSVRMAQWRVNSLCSLQVCEWHSGK